MRRENDYIVKKVMKMDLEGRRKKGKLKRWKDYVEDLREKKI